MTLPHAPEGDNANLIHDLDRRIANLEGKVGNGLSHNDLIDTEDHKTFLKQDGSVPVVGTLDFSKSGGIKNTNNRILNVDIFNGAVQLDNPNNQLIANEGDLKHDLLKNLLWSLAGHIMNANFLPDADGTRDIGSAALGWKDLYLTGTLYIDDTNSLTHDGTTFVFNGAVTITDGLDVNLLATDSIIIDGATDERLITVGAMRQLHTPGIAGTRAYNIVVDANNQPDTKAITVEYTATGLSGGDTNAGIELTVDTSNSTGGEIDGLHVSSVGSGSVATAAIHANSGVDPIRHSSGTLGDIESAWENAVEYTTEFKTAGGANDVELFSSNGDIVYVGDATMFSDITVVLAVSAGNPGIKPTFEYSAGSGSWTAFGATDGSNGFRVNGVINWNPNDLSGWATDTVNGVASKYWIRITRTASGSVSPLPKESLIGRVAATRFMWDKDGKVTINDLVVPTIAGSIAQHGTLIIQSSTDEDKGIMTFRAGLDTSGIVFDFDAKTEGDYQETVAGEPGIIGYWKMDNDAWVDSVGTHDGTAQGGTIFTTDSAIGSHAGSFDGINDRIDVPNSADWAFGTGDFAIEAWIKPSALATDQFVGTAWLSGSWNGGWGWNMDVSGTLKFGIAGVDVITQSAPASIVALVYQHIAVVRSSGVVTFYVNGISQGGGAYTSNLIQDTLRIGDFNSGNDYTGLMDEVAIYDEALTSTQVLNHFNLGVVLRGVLNIQNSGGGFADLKVGGDIYGGANLTELNLLPSVDDGGSAIAYKYDTENSLATAGANHSQWLNNATDLMTLDKDGNLGIGTALPTQPLSVQEKASMTAIGGIAIKLTNQTGANTVQGQTVRADTASDDAVILTAASDDECFGVFLESGIADGSEAWVVVAGIADVAMAANTAATHGNWIGVSTEAGYADATGASPPAAPTHFEEVGHCIESVAAGGAGTHILARCVLHFN